MTRTRMIRLAAIAVLVLVLAEFGARALGPHLPAPDLYADETTAVKVRQLERLHDRDRCATVVIAGNSMARDDLVPSVLRDGFDDGVAVYNASLDAAAPTLLDRWVPDHVVPKADPDLIVIGLSSFDLNDNARISTSALDGYETSTLTRQDFFGRLQAPLVERLALFEHRGELRDPSVVWAALGRLHRGERTAQPSADGIAGVLDADGAGLSRRDLRYNPSPATDTLLGTELLNDFAIGGVQTEALDDLLDRLGRTDMAAVLTLLPVTDDYVAAHPGGRAQYDRFLSLAEEIAIRHEVTLLDLHDWGVDADFADTHHLAGAAADRLSQELPGRLERLGVALPRC